MSGKNFSLLNVVTFSYKREKTTPAYYNEYFIKIKFNTHLNSFTKL